MRKCKTDEVANAIVRFFKKHGYNAKLTKHFIKLYNADAVAKLFLKKDGTVRLAITPHEDAIFTSCYTIGNYRLIPNWILGLQMYLRTAPTLDELEKYLKMLDEII